jgi:hypothetical protein
MFKLLGALVALYTLRAAWRGEVLAKAGIGYRTVLADESPRYFWLVIACYGALGLALLTIF